MTVQTLKVFVRGLTLAAEVGVHTHEYGRRQPLLADIELDLHPASCEHITDTVSYAAIVAKAQALAASGHFKLIETFAEQLGLACLEDPKVIRARVRLEKARGAGPRRPSWGRGGGGWRRPVKR